MKIQKYTLGGRGVRIVLLPDLHNQPYEHILADVIAQSPDLIAIAGDLTDGYDQYDKVGGFLKACAGIAPTYLSLGNHDSLQEKGLAQFIAESGVTLLDNAYVDTAVKGVPLRIGGLTSPSSRYHGINDVVQTIRHTEKPEPDTAWLPDFCETSSCKVLLCHQPEYYPVYLADYPIDLILAGHAHGGQWRIPFTKQGVYAPGQGCFPKLTGGVTDGRLVISRGISNPSWVPRFFNPREIVVIEI